MISVMLNCIGIWASVASIIFALICRDKNDNKIACHFVLSIIWPLSLLNAILVPIFSVVLVIWKFHVMLSSAIIILGDTILRIIAIAAYKYSIAAEMLHKGEVTLIEDTR